MIEKTLVLSTGHITEQTSNRLIELQKMNPEYDGLPFRFVNHHYGFIIFVSPVVFEDEGGEILEQFPDVHALLQYAIKKGCTMINLDQDADFLEDLPTYEW